MADQSQCQSHTSVQMDEVSESFSTKCVFDRLPPEMIRFTFRKLSTEDLLQASATTDRLYRVAQHHLYLSDGALLVRGGQDTAATVAGAYDVHSVSSLYLVDVTDFYRDVPKKMLRRAADDADNDDADNDDADGDDADSDYDSDGENDARTAPLDVLHVGYAKKIKYTDLPADGVRWLLSGVRAKRVCFSNVLMTADDVADVVSALLEAGGCDGEPPVLRCSYDRADDGEMLALLDHVECTCAGLLAEFRVTVRRPAPRSYAIYPMSCVSAAAADYDNDDDVDDDGGAADADERSEAAAIVAAELPEDLLSLSAADCSGLRPAAYKRLGVACRQLRRLCMKAARQVEDDGFEAVAAMPTLQHLDMDGLPNVSSDGLLNGLEKASGLQSLGLSACPYVTDSVLHRVGELRRLRRLRLDLTDCDKTTAAGVLDMLAGCERIQELNLTLPLDADYVDAVAYAAQLQHLKVLWLTFERLSFQDHMDNQPADDDWQRSLAARFRGDVDFRVQQTFTKVTVSVD